jgi:hypothetical protein
MDDVAAGVDDVAPKSRANGRKRDDVGHPVDDVVAGGADVVPESGVT